MTRVKFISGVREEEFEASVNAALETIEADGYGCQAILYRDGPPVYSVLIVYSKGYIKTTRWTGGVL